MGISEQYRDTKIDQYLDIKTGLSLAAQGATMSDRLTPHCNEWYLFHGTNSRSAKKICSTSFKMSLAGDTAGTLYGNGTYMCEAITKADEYAKPNEEGLFAVLLC